MGTSYDPPTEEESKGNAKSMMQVFEEEMTLGPNLNAHIPSFIADGLATLRKNFAAT